MKIQEIIQKIRQNSALLLLESQNANYLSICLDIYNEIKDLSTDKFDSLLEAVGEDVLSRKVVIQACLYFDPELNKDEQDIDKRIRYLNKLINDDINVNNALHLYTRAPLELAIMSNSVKIVEFLIKEKKANLQGEQIQYVLGLMDYNLDMITDVDGKADTIKILQNVAELSINGANSEGCESILDFMSEQGIEFESDMNREGRNIKEVLSKLSKTNMSIFAKDIKEENEETRDKAYELLELAIKNGLVVLVEKLINLVPDINVKVNFPAFYDKLPILYGAMRYNQLEITKLLIEKGADISLPDRIFGVLYTASHSAYDNKYSTNTDLELLKYVLVKFREREYIEDSDGRGPLHSAEFGDHEEIIKELVARGVDINDKINMG